MSNYLSLAMLAEVQGLLLWGSLHPAFRRRLERMEAYLISRCNR